MISAKYRSETGFPVLWLFEGSGNMQYRGPKDVDSLGFFINKKLGEKSKKEQVNNNIDRNLLYKKHYA